MHNVFSFALNAIRFIQITDFQNAIQFEITSITKKMYKLCGTEAVSVDCFPVLIETFQRFFVFMAGYFVHYNVIQRKHFSV